MKKTITLLTILMLVVFMVGCENLVNPIQSQTQNDNDGINLAKKGGGDIATFNIDFSGVIGGTDTWAEQVLRKGAKSISSPYNQFFPMTFNWPTPCIGPGADGILMIQRHDRKNPELARVMFWFEGPGDGGGTLTYVLVLDGTFEDGKQWPPIVGVGNKNEITIDFWELMTEGNPKKYKAIPCELVNPPSGTIKVTVTRTL